MNDRRGQDLRPSGKDKVSMFGTTARVSRTCAVTHVGKAYRQDSMARGGNHQVTCPDSPSHSQWQSGAGVSGARRQTIQ